MAKRVFIEEGCENTNMFHIVFSSISEAALAKTEMLKRFIFGREET